MRRRMNRAKGFTLVELIVVIAILGTLVGIAVPALVGYIEKAKHESVVVECRQLVVAAQTLSSERLASGNPLADGAVATEDPFWEEVEILGEKPQTGTINSMEFRGSVLTKLEYTNNGITVLYNNGEYSVDASSDEVSSGESSLDDSVLDIVDPKTGETIEFDVVEFVPGMKISELKGKTFWYEGDDKLEAGYYYLDKSLWLANDKPYESLRDAIYASDNINYNKIGNQRKFRLVNTEAPIQTYNWSDWKDLSNNDRNKKLGEFLQFGQFYYVDFEGTGNYVLAMYRGSQESYTYHSYLGDIANPNNGTWSDYWTLASDM